MSFLPQDYKSPSSSNYYLKLQEGENRIRILTQPILGWEDWTKDKKPVRYEMDNKPAKSIDPARPLKHFWAFVVFNYAEEAIQIMHITQNSIRKSIEALCRDQDWGDPYAYDIKITKSGTGMDTEYTVNPVPHKLLDPYVVQCFNAHPCNLEALFVNADPFSPEWKVHTPLAGEITPDFESPKTVKLEVPRNDKITPQEAEELDNLIGECEEKIQVRIWNYIEKLCKSRDLLMVTKEAYAKIKPIVLEKRAEHQYSILKDQPHEEVGDE